MPFPLIAAFQKRSILEGISWYSTSMTKDEVLDLLQGIKQSTLFGYILKEHATQSGMANIARKCLTSEASQWSIKAKSGVHPESLHPLGSMLLTPEGRRTAEGNYFLSLDFSLLRFTHEIVWDYCVQTNQQSDYQSAGDLYRVARVARNVVSHGDGAVLSVWPRNYQRQGITQVNWEDIEFRDDQVGAQVYVDTRQIFRLHHAIRSHVEGVLS